MPMMAITTSSSTSVKPRRRRRDGYIVTPLSKRIKTNPDMSSRTEEKSLVRDSAILPWILFAAGLDLLLLNPAVNQGMCRWLPLANDKSFACDYPTSACDVKQNSN